MDSVIHPSRGKERLHRLWAKIKEEFHHYKSGAVLLWADIKHSVRILRKVLHGSELTFRERKQLKRTTMDLLRMIPFAFFIIVPFLEFLLPVALWAFPNMLPSQFQSKLKKQEDRTKQLKLRLDLAKFLEETLEEFAQDVKKQGPLLTQTFWNFSLL
ncbi:hypothetical protein RFI_15232 [Reticulomyxa filosa]|uniref:Letm1 RBD domain-containing protein n=1 Tax=Reticulomyxa filosa TaxID=46433 RepID=X6N6S8_RETFI|nr:hypothetical protein RFI_15232 [Reticulomyxa filosa]|eukprot:ETO21970.1 hypothetical protein RFI_15232 [Reticulomyxa filosa]